MAKKTKWHREPAFLALRDEWYRKLEKSGFRDAELINPRTQEPSTNLLRGNGNYSSQTDFLRNYGTDLERWHERLRQHYWTMLEEGKSEEDAEICRLVGNGASKAMVTRILGLSVERVSKVLKEQVPNALLEEWLDD